MKMAKSSVQGTEVRVLTEYHDNFLEVRHPRCVEFNNKEFCVLHLQSNTTIFHPVVQ